MCFKAVGVFTGPRSKGLVILDVDRNLAKLKSKWGESLQGAPVVTSTKANAAKYLYSVPEALWGEVSGFGLSDTGAGYEVLWGRQGLLYGAYPGSSDGKGAEGFYGFEGDLEVIPEAPAWLLAEMKDHAGKDPTDGGFIKNRKALTFQIGHLKRWPKLFSRLSGYPWSGCWQPGPLDQSWYGDPLGAVR
jgi:hypothetical protein